jgi:hypothetical protein
MFTFKMWKYLVNSNSLNSQLNRGKNSLFLITMLFSSLALSADFVITDEGVQYQVPLGGEFIDFVVKSPSTGSEITVDPSTKASLFVAAQKATYLISNKPSTGLSLRKQDNQLKATVSKLRSDIIGLGVNTFLNSTSSIFTSAGKALLGVVAAPASCTIGLLSGPVACGSATGAIGTGLVGFADSAAAGMITLSTNEGILESAENAIDVAKQIIEYVNAQELEFTTSRLEVIRNNSSSIEELYRLTYLEGDITSNAQLTVNFLKQIEIDPGNVVDSVLTGVVTAFGTGRSTAQALLEISAGVEQVSAISSLTSDVLQQINTSITDITSKAEDIAQIELLTKQAELQHVEAQQQTQNEQQKRTEEALLLVAALNAIADKDSSINNIDAYEEARRRQWNDLDDMRDDIDDISDDIKNADTLSELEAALDDAKEELDRAEFFERRYDREYDKWVDVIEDLEKSYIHKVCIGSGSFEECWEDSDLPNLRQRAAEARVLKEEFSDYVNRNGGLDDVYDAGRGLRDAWRKQEQKEAEARLAKQQAQEAATAALLALQQAQELAVQVDILASDVVVEEQELQVVEVAPEGNPDEGFAAKLVTGSPIFISQLVDTPIDPFNLGFDFLFEDSLGSLDVFLGDSLLDSLLGSNYNNDEFLHWDFFVDDPLLLGQNNLELKFLFDDVNSGISLWLDNITFPGLLDGTFDGGLTFWDPVGDGFVVVSNFILDTNSNSGDPNNQSPNIVSEPSIIFLMINGLLLVFIRRIRFKTKI